MRCNGNEDPGEAQEAITVSSPISTCDPHQFQHRLARHERPFVTIQMPCKYLQYMVWLWWKTFSDHPDSEVDGPTVLDGHKKSFTTIQILKQILRLRQITSVSLQTYLHGHMFMQFSGKWGQNIRLPPLWGILDQPLRLVVFFSIPEL